MKSFSQSTGSSQQNSAGAGSGASGAGGGSSSSSGGNGTSIVSSVYSDSTGATAVSANQFMSSLGINIHNDQGYGGLNYAAPLQYLGIRNIRDGINNLQNLVGLHQQAGVLANITAYGDLNGLIAAAHTLASSGALLSVEGPNEPNNFTFTYNGQTAGGFGPSSNWTAVAQMQRDLYQTVKSDPVLKNTPVFSVSEAGAEGQNVGLQFLTIPAGAGCTMPDGTQYADFANPHNYVSSTTTEYIDNMAWQAADPTLAKEWDSLFGEYGTTWANHYAGYTNAQLQTLPRVSTETGWDSVGNPGGETVQGKVLVNTYLSQFKRGWAYTFIYELADGEGSSGNQGVFRGDYTKKPAADYIHNMTTVLNDTANISSPGKLNYSIANEPATTHDLLLQKGSGVFELVVWSERATGSDNITVNLGAQRSAVKIYDITTGTSPIQTLTNVSTIPLNMSDHAFILEITN
jgi:hypothetical protein